MTEVDRIDLAASPDVDAEIKSVCDNRKQFGGYHLAATFVVDGELVLIFQK